MRINEVRDTSKSIQMLEKKRVDCIVGDHNTILYNLKQLKADGTVEKSFLVKNALTITREKGFIGYARKGAKFPFKDDFIEKLDEALYKVYSDGELDKVRALFQ